MNKLPPCCYGQNPPQEKSLSFSFFYVPPPFRPFPWAAVSSSEPHLEDPEGLQILLPVTASLFLPFQVESAYIILVRKIKIVNMQAYLDLRLRRVTAVTSWNEGVPHDRAFFVEWDSSSLSPIVCFEEDGVFSDGGSHIAEVLIPEKNEKASRPTPESVHLP